MYIVTNLPAILFRY